MDYNIEKTIEKTIETEKELSILVDTIAKEVISNIDWDIKEHFKGCNDTLRYTIHNIIGKHSLIGDATSQESEKAALVFYIYNSEEDVVRGTVLIDIDIDYGSLGSLTIERDSRRHYFYIISDKMKTLFEKFPQRLLPLLRLAILRKFVCAINRRE